MPPHGRAGPRGPDRAGDRRGGGGRWREDPPRARRARARGRSWRTRARTGSWRASSTCCPYAESLLRRRSAREEVIDQVEDVDDVDLSVAVRIRGSGGARAAGEERVDEVEDV